MQQLTHFQPLFVMILAVALLLNSCNKKADKQTENNTEAKTALTNNQNTEIVAVYQSCTVYTGSTQYFFQSEKGDTIAVSVLNKELADDETLIAKVPDELIDNNPNLEGVAGENPKMVGKKFKIVYNPKGEVIEVKAN